MNKKEELQKQIEECKNIIAIDVGKIEENAKGNYSPNIHGKMIDEIDDLRIGILIREAELKGIKEGIKSQKAKEKKFIKLFRDGDRYNAEYIKQTAKEELK